MTTKKTPKTPKLFTCDICDFVCRKKCDYNRHLTTRKHEILTKGLTEKTPENICKCGKKYKHRQSLYNHQRTCPLADKEEEPITQPTQAVEQTNQAIINAMNNLVEENKKQREENIKHMETITELTSTIREMAPKMGNNNKSINIFLNEQCKDAMNIKDFVDSISLQIEDVQNVGKLGYVDGISNIIVNNLSTMEVSKRPIHCSDAKKEIMYVKDHDVWEKENEDRSKLKQVVEEISNKNIMMLHQAHDTQDVDNSVKMVSEATGGGGDKTKKDDQIIKNIAKAVVLD